MGPAEPIKTEEGKMFAVFYCLYSGIAFLSLVAILMAVLPISKLLHAPGLFFSPTFNQVDDARERRYTSGWSAGKRGGP